MKNEPVTFYREIFGPPGCPDAGSERREIGQPLRIRSACFSLDISKMISACRPVATGKPASTSSEYPTGRPPGVSMTILSGSDEILEASQAGIASSCEFHRGAPPPTHSFGPAPGLPGPE